MHESLRLCSLFKQFHLEVSLAVLMSPEMGRNRSTADCLRCQWFSSLHKYTATLWDGIQSAKNSALLLGAVLGEFA